MLVRYVLAHVQGNTASKIASKPVGYPYPSRFLRIQTSKTSRPPPSPRDNQSAGGNDGAHKFFLRPAWTDPYSSNWQSR